MTKLTLTDDEAIAALQEGWDLLMNNARIIAMLPLEDWLQQFERAESVAPVLDPTLYRNYLYSDKGEIIKSIIRAALPLKKAVLDAQPAVRKEIESEAHP